MHLISVGPLIQCWILLQILVQFGLAWPWFSPSYLGLAVVLSWLGLAVVLPIQAWPKKGKEKLVGVSSTEISLLRPIWLARLISEPINARAKKGKEKFGRGSPTARPYKPTIWLAHLNLGSQ